MGFIKRLFTFFIIVILLGILAYYYPNFTGESVKDSGSGYEKEPAFFTRAIDGDTIEVEINGNKEKIRLLGINTLEKGMPYSKKATEFLKTFEGKDVELLRDNEDFDRYERKLRYLFYGGNLINAEILQEGLATSFMIDGLSYQKNLEDAEDFARKSKIGIWKESSEKCAECIKLKELNAEIEYFIIENRCDFNCNLTGWFVKDDANHFFYLNNLDSNKAKNYNSEIEVWNDGGDRFFMRDDRGDLVIFYEY
ncbi:MAG: thermonuclease family protein [Candidatus Nanoarchaeia archaeon]|nr:thermonuclease family protein [Candidatus Nanoarchaeia archaeon]